MEDASFNQFFFGLFYFFQGLAQGAQTLMPVYFKRNGVSHVNIGLFGALSQGTAIFKIPLCIISDRYNFFGLGFRRPYIAIGMLGAALGKTGYGLVDLFSNVHDMFPLFMFINCIMSICSHLADGVVDGFAAETVPPQFAGRTQAVMNVSRGLGTIIGIGSTLAIADNVGWFCVFFISSVGTALKLFFVSRLNELDTHRKRVFNWRAFRVFQQRSIYCLVGFCFLVAAPGGLSLILISTYLSSPDEINASSTSISIILGLAGLGLMFGAGLSGYLVDKYRRSMLKIFIGGLLFAGAAALGLCLTPKQDIELVAIFIIGGGTAIGIGMAAYLSMAMLLTEPAISSTFFGILATWWNLSVMTGQLVSGPILDTVGYRWSFGISLLIGVFALPLLPFIFGKNGTLERKELAESQITESVSNLELQELSGKENIEFDV